MGISGYNGFIMKTPPATHRINAVNAITQKAPDGLFSSLAHILEVRVSELINFQRPWSKAKTTEPEQKNEFSIFFKFPFLTNF